MGLPQYESSSRVVADATLHNRRALSELCSSTMRSVGRSVRSLSQRRLRTLSNVVLRSGWQSQVACRSVSTSTAVLSPAKRRDATAAGSAVAAASADSDVYQRKSAVEHVLLRPGMYIGSTGEASDVQWLLNASSGTMELQHVVYNPGLVKIFDEILVNAVDNGVREPSQSRIEVTIEPGSADGVRPPVISVLNDGKSIPVRRHATEGPCAPRMPVSCRASQRVYAPYGC